MSGPLRFPRIRISLPPEGLVFVVILGFVTVCSVLRSVNMLVVVSGMMFVPLLLCWRLSRHAVRNVKVHRVASGRIHAGQPVSIQWQAENLGRLNLFQLKVSDTIRQTFSRGGEVQTTAKKNVQRSTGTLVFDRILSGETSYSSYQVLFAERGVYEAGPAVVECKFPFSLVKCWFRASQLTTIYVAPMLGKLVKNWDRIISANTPGLESRAQREGSQEEEFFAIREWRSGDNIRKIHWRSTAKYRQPMIKQFDRLTEQNIAIVLDLFENPGAIHSDREFGESGSQALACETILRFAATVLSEWSDVVNGKLTIGIAGQTCDVFSSSDRHEFKKHTMRSLAIAQSGFGVHLGMAVSHVLGQTPGGTTCFVISSRSSRQAALDLGRERLARTRWINVCEKELDEAFSCSEMDAQMEIEKINPDLIEKD